MPTNAVALVGTDVASSFCVPAEAVVASLKHVRAGSSAPVFIAVDTRNAAAFGRGRLPTALHVPVLAEDAVSFFMFCLPPLISLLFMKHLLFSRLLHLVPFSFQGLILHPPVSHITTMRQAIEKLMPLNGKRHMCLIMTASYDETPQDERAGVIRLITLMRRRGVRFVNAFQRERRY